MTEKRTLFRIAIKRRPGAAQGFGINITAFDRPYPVAYNEKDAVTQLASAHAQFPHAEEIVCLVADDYDELERQYEAYRDGRAFRQFDPSPDGMRKHIEFAPLRDDYDLPPDYRPFRFELFSKDEMRGLIRLMRRVQIREELGGPNDGAE